MSEDEAITLFQKCAEIFEVKRSLSLAAVAARIDFSTKYVREHLSDFPNAWRASGGEIRIPVRDVVALERSRRIFSPVKSSRPPMRAETTMAMVGDAYPKK